MDVPLVAISFQGTAWTAAMFYSSTEDKLMCIHPIKIEANQQGRNEFWRICRQLLTIFHWADSQYWVCFKRNITMRALKPDLESRSTSESESDPAKS